MQAVFIVLGAVTIWLSGYMYGIENPAAVVLLILGAIFLGISERMSDDVV